MMRIAAVVAAKDESDRIGQTVRGLLEIPDVVRVVVADDGSVDGTAIRAAGAGATVTRRARSRGKGTALEAGVDVALAEGDVDALLFADADLGDTARGLGSLVPPVADGSADLAIAVFPPLSGGGFGVVKRSSRAAIRVLSGYRASEPLSGQRLVAIGFLDALRPFADGFGVETAMTIDAARAGLRIVEVPCDLAHRPTGRSVRGFVHRARQGRDIAGAVSRRAVGRP